jgi:hypothetical protein
MPEVSFPHDRQQIPIPIAIIAPGDGSTVKMERVTGLFDTGAMRSGVSRAVADAVRLPRAGRLAITTPQGEHVARLYRFMVGLFPEQSHDGQLPFVLHTEFLGIECSPGAKFDALTGMDVIGSGDLTITRSGTGSFRF